MNIIGTYISSNTNTYKVESLLGSGASGMVYLVRDQQNILKAMKIQEFELIKRQNEQNEFPNIIRYFDEFKCSPRQQAFIMEYADGGNLNAYRSRKTPNTQEILAIMLDISKAIQALHQYTDGRLYHGLIHRDIKPENIVLITNSSILGFTCKLCDLGLIKLLQQQDTRMTINAGTPYYQAPEVSHPNYGKPVDIWSLGVLFYELITNQLLFPGVTCPQVEAEISAYVKNQTNKLQLIEQMSTEVEYKKLIKEMIQVNPELRPKIEQIVTKFDEFYMRTNTLRKPYSLTKKEQINNIVQVNHQHKNSDPLNKLPPVRLSPRPKPIILVRKLNNDKQQFGNINCTGYKPPIPNSQITKAIQLSQQYKDQTQHQIAIVEQQQLLQNSNEQQSQQLEQPPTIIQIYRPPQQDNNLSQQQQNQQIQDPLQQNQSINESYIDQKLLQMKEKLVEYITPTHLQQTPCIGTRKQRLDNLFEQLMEDCQKMLKK